MQLLRKPALLTLFYILQIGLGEEEIVFMYIDQKEDRVQNLVDCFCPQLRPTNTYLQHFMNVHPQLFEQFCYQTNQQTNKSERIFYLPEVTTLNLRQSIDAL